MSWWGKLLGGTVGFWLGGPLGAVIGAALGHRVDRQSAGTPLLDGMERRQTAFFTATFAVMGHLAKSDGRVSADEIALANRLMQRLDLAPHTRDFARHLFTEGKRADFPLDDILAQFAREARSRDLKRMFLEIQVFAAYADGHMHHAERNILARVCQHLGFDAAALAQVEALVRAELGQEFGAGAALSSLDDAYDLLGVPAEASDAEIKRAYRRLMSQHHPDKLVAKGLPEEMMKLATAKTQQIKGAYERIKEVRGSR